jgi:putative flavoprotein involved in K+ transport
LNALPGAPYDGSAPDGFHTRDELVASFTNYLERFDLPVRTGVAVDGVEAASGWDEFNVLTCGADGLRRTIRARSVVVASGMLNKPKLPSFADSLPAELVQMHAADYRNPQTLPPGAAMVVGSGQSGCQIAEELVAAGRRVFLCTSRVGRQPRRYRGRDIVEWEWDSGILHLRRTELDDPSIMAAPQPQVSGVGRFGHTVSLQQLALAGVTLLGRIAEIRGSSIIFDDSLRENIRYADRVSEDCKREIDAYIASNGIGAPEREDEPADRPWECLDTLPMQRQLDVVQADIGSLIWCTGFSGDFSWLSLPVLDKAGKPVHDRGASPVDGIYFVGIPWLHRRKSGIICGVEEDASHIVQQIRMRRTGSARNHPDTVERQSSLDAHAAQV